MAVIIAVEAALLTIRFWISLLMRFFKKIIFNTVFIIYFQYCKLALKLSSPPIIKRLDYYLFSSWLDVIKFIERLRFSPINLFYLLFLFVTKYLCMSHLA